MQKLIIAIVAMFANVALAQEVSMDVGETNPWFLVLAGVYLLLTAGSVVATKFTKKNSLPHKASGLTFFAFVVGLVAAALTTNVVIIAVIATAAAFFALMSSLSDAKQSALWLVCCGMLAMAFSSAFTFYLS